MTDYSALEPVDREAAIAILGRRLDGADLRAVLDDTQGRSRRRRRRERKKSIESIVIETEHEGRRARSRLPPEDLPAFLVDLAGSDLLASRELRLRLARRASPDELERLHEYPWGSRGRGGRESVARAVSERNWHPGKAWATHFVRTLGFPLTFAGVAGTPQEPDSMDVEPFRPLPDLQDFQLELNSQLMEVLTSPAGKNRAILALPTGAGKTRTAVETLVQWRLGTAEGSRGILWVAQSDELCEQAVQAFREVWVDLGHRAAGIREPITINRLWGAGRAVPATTGVVVSSIQKLHAISRGGDSDSRKEELAAIVPEIGAVVVDEAHRMLAPTYGQVLGFLGIDVVRGGRSTTPLIGLTATPFRAVEEETHRLATRFHGQLLRPTSLGDDPVAELRSRGVLSRPVHGLASYDGPTFSIDEHASYREYFETFNDFHPGLLRRIGEERRRNRRLLDALSDLSTDWPVLFFGCSVEHATAMSALLRRRGRSSAVVTSATRAATRRALIEDFRRGSLSVLCNYGVLTTGFDAPRVRALVVARPTTSPVLYEQMIGRGMRGPRFGGTEECLVIDVEDNIQFGGQLAFTRYDEYWAGPGP